MDNHNYVIEIRTTDGRLVGQRYYSNYLENEKLHPKMLTEIVDTVKADIKTQNSKCNCTCRK